MSSLLDSWETLVASLSNFASNGVLQLAMVKIVCLMKKLEERIWARILHMPLSQRTKGEVRVEVLKGEVNPKVDQNQKENSNAFTVIKVT